jgi:hypothetical protein
VKRARVLGPNHGGARRAVCRLAACALGSHVRSEPVKQAKSANNYAYSQVVESRRLLSTEYFLAIERFAGPCREKHRARREAVLAPHATREA